MAVAVAFPAAAKGMIPQPRRQGIIAQKQLDHRHQNLIQLRVGLFLALVVALELGGSDEGAHGGYSNGVSGCTQSDGMAR